MNNFWKGTFSPTFSKRIGTARLVPLDRMTDSDYDWLDWPEIRTSAKNRLALKIIMGLVAFIDFRLDGPEEEDEDDRTTVVGRTPFIGRAKRRYIFGATSEDEDEFEEDNHDFFRHGPDDDELNEAAEALEDFMDDLSLENREDILAALAAMSTDELLDNALAASIGLSDDNFIFFAAIATAYIASATGSSFERTAQAVLDRVSRAGSIAAGRGL